MRGYNFPLMKKKGTRRLFELPPPAPPAQDARAWGTALGVTLILLGIVVLGLAGGDLMKSARGIHELSLPASRQLQLSAGVYAGVAKPGAPAPSDPSLNVTVEDSLTGRPVPVMMVPGGGRNLPLFQFQVLDAGEYRVSAVGGLEKVLLVHGSLAESRSGLWVGLLTCGTLAGLGIYLVWWSRRRRPAA